ncbi:glycosyltransferase [Candidatus Gottesmanbacteria bacterium]|nr:glycosyltransferase [Candidatus Gottesmanbacteria bacterium]
MKIGVDATVLADHNGVKAGNYHLAHNLLKALGKIDKKNEYLLYSYKPIAKELLKLYPKNFHNLILRPQKGWMQIRLSLEQIVRPVDVFLGLNQALPYFVKSKSMVFCLDLAFEKFAQYFANAKKLSWQTKRAVKIADQIIAISESTKNDLQDMYHVESSKIRVINLA